MQKLPSDICDVFKAEAIRLQPAAKQKMSHQELGNSLGVFSPAYVKHKRERRVLVENVQFATERVKSENHLGSWTRIRAVWALEDAQRALEEHDAKFL